MAIRLPDSELSERRGYHHGDLRRALVEAARRLIAERGPAGFTLSDAAKLAGVSPAAPYRHFKDRQALLAEVSRLGFAALARRLQSAHEAGGDEGFLAMGHAYLAFAREEPAFYAAMFNTGMSDDRERAGDDDGFALLKAAVGRAMGQDQPDRVELAATLVFALTHGLASLSAAGMVGGADRAAAEADHALEIGVDALIRGLAGAATASAKTRRDG